MTREPSTGVCEQCQRQFSYWLMHNGFNDSAYAYCDSCEYSVSLNGRHKGIPVGARLQIHKRIAKDVEPFLKPCPCGGTFRADVSPKCPHCHQSLSPVVAKAYLEANAAGTSKGWRWQENWSDIYSIIIDTKCVTDWWKE
jgi:hypothetical protein